MSLRKWLHKKSKYVRPRSNRMTFSGFKRRSGYLWQDRDGERVISKRLEAVSDCDKAVGYCKQKRVCVQAGGHSGLYPARLSRHFDAVYTFEPDHQNMLSLAVNTRDENNILKFQAALGDKVGFIDLNRSAGGSGSNHVEGRGFIPMLTIDFLELPACDLIYLDIEGYELQALKGARQTIQAYSPVIVLEDKGHSVRFGIESEGAIRILQDEFDYTIAEKTNNDVILVCEGSA